MNSELGKSITRLAVLEPPKDNINTGHLEPTSNKVIIAEWITMKKPYHCSLHCRRTNKESDITPISIKHTTTQDELLLVSCNHIYSVCSIQTSQMERKSITLRFHRPSPTLECLKPFVVFNPKGKRLEFMPHVQVPFFSILLLLLRTQLPSSSLKIY